MSDRGDRRRSALGTAEGAQDRCRAPCRCTRCVHVNAVATTPDGAIVTGGEDRRVPLWDGHDGRLRRTWSGHDGVVHGVAVHADRIVSVGSDGRILCWRPDRDAPVGGSMITVDGEWDVAAT